MHVDLREDDVEFLREVLDSTMRNLTSEIAHTDSRLYRRGLQERRERLRGMIDLFGGSPSAEPRQGQAG